MNSAVADDHDAGLQHDLNLMMERRRALGWFVSAGAILATAACSGSSSGSATTTTTAGGDAGSASSADATSSGECIADPQETAGPYPADGSNSTRGSVVNVLDDAGIVRGDMRSSFGEYDGLAEGVQMDLVITVVDVDNACSPLEGYAVYIWHCDVNGDYSLYDLPDENYLRAVGVTDANGQVAFTTIFPGCYNGRYPHIHFEVYESLDAASDYRNKILTSQMAMPENDCTAVYNSSSVYDASAANFTNESISTDNVFGDNTAAEIAQQTPELSGDPYAGYAAKAIIGIVR